MSDENQGLLEIKKAEQKKVVEELIEKSRATSPYNLLLILSAVITASGILVGSWAIVIGGMLVTPLLTPILAIALGITMGNLGFIWRSVKITLKSIATIIAISLIFGFLFPSTDPNNELIREIRFTPLYFIVALASGIAATFAWTRESISEALPGVAVAVSLVPPLSILGIAIGLGDIDLMRDPCSIFIFNFLGIVIGSLVVFSLMKFYRTREEAKQHIKQEEKQAQAS